MELLLRGFLMALCLTLVLELLFALLWGVRKKGCCWWS